MKWAIFALVLLIQSIFILAFNIQTLPAILIGVTVGILSGLALFGRNDHYEI